MFVEAVVCVRVRACVRAYVGVCVCVQSTAPKQLLTGWQLQGRTACPRPTM